MYNSGGTIRDALGRIQRNEYVLPAIQREFVWKPEQIERLFDSLMQGYPFGTFLFWRVNSENIRKFKFYDFVLNYHQRDAAHCQESGLIDHAVTAVLDGQQRLTALNIGLRGSMAMKLPNKWWNSADAFPRRVLRLNLTAAEVTDEDGARFEFRFLDEAQVARDPGCWFDVPEILTLESGPSMLAALQSRGLQGDDLNRAFARLHKLHEVVHLKPLINFYEEQDQDLERVLNIFIRLNSGGTVLSYSDLLLSIAVAQWKQIDARSEIHRLVDEINRIGAGFNLSQDFVLKAGLMLADIRSVGFKVQNFTAENMAALEAKWPEIRAAIVRTVELVSTFGFNGQSLRADSALLPIAYYLHRRNAPANYATHTQFANDREAIRGWLVRSLIKASGIWGSGLDTLLTALREAIEESDASAFPVERLSEVLDVRGKSLVFSDAEVDDLLNLQYEDRRTFPLLSMLYPFLDFRNQFHIDHVFPKSRFDKRALTKLGLSEDKIQALQEKANALPNLQLLEGVINNEKRAALPGEWIKRQYPDAAAQGHYRSIHDLGHLPEGIAEFEAFSDARKERLRDRLKRLLQARAGAEAVLA